mgnify:CR=1 FL=1
MEGLSFATVLVGGGGIAAVAGIIGAVIQGLFGRGEKKATAAAQLSQSAASLSEQWEKANKGLEEKLAKVDRKLDDVTATLEVLTDKVDEVIPLLEQAGHAQIAVDLRDANRTVRRVI